VCHVRAWWAYVAVYLSAAAEGEQVEAKEEKKGEEE
jgi:hypothetical protein